MESSRSTTATAVHSRVVIAAKRKSGDFSRGEREKNQTTVTQNFRSFTPCAVLLFRSVQSIVFAFAGCFGLQTTSRMDGLIKTNKQQTTNQPGIRNGLEEEELERLPLFLSKDPVMMIVLQQTTDLQASSISTV